MTLHSVKLAAAGDEQIEPAKQITFDDFWSLYPRRVARKDALKAWQKIDPIHHNDILEAVPYHKRTEDWRKDGGKYIPYPASWLNGERWTDEMETDLSMGECQFNCNGNMGDFPKCTAPATTEKRGVVYCKAHADRG